MIRKFWVVITLQAVLFIILMLPTYSNATLLTIDEIIFQDNGTNVSLLSGTADASFAGGVLTIVLINTSTGVASPDSASNLLTGIGFNLPSGVTIDPVASFIAITSGSSAINFSGSLGQDTWGIDNGPLTSGPFQNTDIITGTVNTTVTTLQASIDFDFNGLIQPSAANVDGPSFGLLSGAVDVSTAGGLEAIQDSVTIYLVLDGLADSTIVDFINNRDVVLSFGSPTPIPEPSTMLLLVSGLLGLGLMVRRSKTF